MIGTALLSLLVVPAAFTSVGIAANGNPSVPRAPDIQPASEEAGQSLQAMRLPEGWTRDLFAAEPLVANIVAFDIDPQGRVYVCETFRQNRGVTDNRGHDDTWLLADLAAQTVQDRIDYHKRLLGDEAAAYTHFEDRIRRLSDTDGDGRADESMIVADGFHRLEEGTGAGVLVRGNDVFYTCIPKLWKLSDETGDGRADERKVLSDGYGVRVAFRGHDLHGPILGPDGRLYFSLGDRGHNVTTAGGRDLADPVSGSVFRCELDGSRLEVVARGLRNPQELAFNDYGDLFTVDNNSDSGDKCRVLQIVHGGDYGWRMHYQYLSDRGPYNREKIWYPYDRQANPEQPAYILPPIANLADGPAGFAFDPGTGGDTSLRGRFLLCDFRGSPAVSGVRSFRLELAGASYRLTDEDQPFWNVLATDVAFGPDGAIWISDWVDGWNGEGKGRIYRIRGPEADERSVRQTAELLAADWLNMDAGQLATQLAHADRRVRNESQWELAGRGETQRLIEVLEKADSPPLARLHALWGIDQSLRLKTSSDSGDSPGRRALTTALTDGDEYIRAAAASAVGERGFKESRDRLVDLLRDESPRVRLHAGLALGALGAGKEAAVFDAAVNLLAENDDAEPLLRHAGVTVLVGSADAARIASLKKHPSIPVRRAAVVALRRLRSAEAGEFLSDSNALVKVEAARAIHDVPLTAGIEALARMIQSPEDDDALVRRILNANYRLGTEAAAIALAEFAAKPIVPPAHRKEAIAMIDAWGRPDPRDRVLNDYRPMPERPPAVAKAALAKVLPTFLKNNDEVREAAIAVAARYGIAEVTPVLRQRAEDRNLSPDARAESLRLLAGIDAQLALAVAGSLMDSGQVKLRIAAMETIAAGDPEAALDILRRGTGGETSAERQAAWDAIARIKTPAARRLIAEGVEDYLAGKLPPDTELNLLEAAQGALDDDLQQRLAAHRARLVEEDPLGRWLPAIAGGDSAAGSEIFKRTQLSCVRCHRVAGTGGEVGPDLTAVGKQRDRRYLLESICLPDATITEGFATEVISDDLGRVVTGIVKVEDDETVELIQPDGTTVRIDQDAIVGRKRGKSAMPEELVNYMSLRELRDLVSYLAGLRGDAAAAK